MIQQPPPQFGVATRRRWAIRWIVRSIVAPSTVTDGQRAVVAAWLHGVARGDEMRRFDLRAELNKRGLTVEQFAAAAGVTGRLVRYWLRGERGPSHDMAVRIARALGIHPSKVVSRVVIRHQSTAARPADYDPTRPLVGRNLAAARAICRLTQDQLSAITGVPRADIAACESAHNTPASGMALKEVQRAIANRLRRRGHRTVTKVDRPPRKKEQHAPIDD